MRSNPLTANLSPRTRLALARRLLQASGETDGHPARLRAFVRWRESATQDAGAVREYLLERLPAHMVPAKIEAVRAWPRLPNGKIDHAALLTTSAEERTAQAPPLQEPAIPSPQTDSNGDGALTRNPVIAKLIELWQTVLGQEQIGLHDDFFALGGHSLLAMQLISRLRVAFDTQLPLRVLFDGPTVAQLAQAIARLRESDTPPAEQANAELDDRESGFI